MSLYIVIVISRLQHTSKCFPLWLSLSHVYQTLLWQASQPLELLHQLWLLFCISCKYKRILTIKVAHQHYFFIMKAEKVNKNNCPYLLTFLKSSTKIWARSNTARQNHILNTAANIIALTKQNDSVLDIWHK